MVKSPRSRGHRSWDTNETERASWTSLMSNTEQDISSSCQRLDQTFKNINRDYEESGHVPNPISIVRRLAALETAIGQLKQDCETVDEKRRDIVQSVMADQIENIRQTKEVGIKLTAQLFSDLEMYSFSNNNLLSYFEPLDAFDNKCWVVVDRQRRI